MKKLCFITILAIALSAIPGPAFGQERRLMTSSSRSRQDCTPLEEARVSSQEAYGEYTSCVINNSYFAFQALYARHLRNFPNETQDVVAKFRVGTDGSVQDAAAESAGMSDSEFLEKIAARIKVIKFLPTGAGPREVSHTFRFSQKGM